MEGNRVHKNFALFPTVSADSRNFRLQHHISRQKKCPCIQTDPKTIETTPKRLKNQKNIIWLVECHRRKTWGHTEIPANLPCAWHGKGPRTALTKKNRGPCSSCPCRQVLCREMSSPVMIELSGPKPMLVGLVAAELSISCQRSCVKKYESRQE